MITLITTEETPTRSYAAVRVDMTCLAEPEATR